MAAFGLLWLHLNQEMALGPMMVQYPGGTKSELKGMSPADPVEEILQGFLR